MPPTTLQIVLQNERAAKMAVKVVYGGQFGVWYDSWVTNCRISLCFHLCAYLCPMLHVILPGQAFPDPFPKGAVFLIDKPLAWTSFDVVNKVRYMLVHRTGNKKLKVGHAGTLDPLATGLLIICVGEYTKRIDEIQSLSKSYEGTITFGATTPSFDLEKAPDTFFSTEHLNLELLEKAKQAFIGDILQVPPIFSAVKVDGKRLYKNARTGQEVEMPHRPVSIESYEFLSDLRRVPPGRKGAIVASKKGAEIMLHPDYENGLLIDFKVVCSKGTYIRSLANDLGQAAQSGAYLSRLVRTASNDYLLENAWKMEDLIAWAGKPQL